MRTITTHHTNDANKAITLEADDRNPENGNASHVYSMHYLEYFKGNTRSSAQHQQVAFQNGPIAEVGVNGITNEVLLAIVIDRLEGFQSSKWMCEANAVALEAVQKALAALEARTRSRVARGVEGTHTV